MIWPNDSYFIVFSFLNNCILKSIIQGSFILIFYWSEHLINLDLWFNGEYVMNIIWFISSIYTTKFIFVYNTPFAYIMCICHIIKTNIKRFNILTIYIMHPYLNRKQSNIFTFYSFIHGVIRILYYITIPLWLYD